MTLNAEQRRALEMLTDAGEGGNTLDMLIANGFPAELLADLVRDGLAMMQGETVKVDERTSEIIRVIITDAGQSAIEDRAAISAMSGLRGQERAHVGAWLTRVIGWPESPVRQHPYARRTS